MPLGLERHRGGDRAAQPRIVAGARAQHVAQLGAVLVAETLQQAAARRDAHPVAVAAEVVAVRRDHADANLAVRHAEITRGAARRNVAREKRVTAANPREYLVARHEARSAVVLIDRAKRHFLDERQIEPLRARETHEIQHFVVVAAAQDHAVQPDAPKPGALRRGDAGQHVAQAARARQRAETVLAQAVQADVDASEARRLQRRGELREARPVGRQGEFVEPGQARDALDERRQAGAHERLAAREPDPAHAERDERPRESGERVERQHVRARQESHVLRHAVHATEVAPVRHRQTHIRDSAAEAIDERAGAVDTRGAGGPARRRLAAGARFAAARARLRTRRHHAPHASLRSNWASLPCTSAHAA